MSTGSGEFKNRQPPMWSPLCLSDEIVAVGSQLAIGALGSPQGVKIRNPNKTAMLVDAFKFVGDGVSPSTSFRTAQLGVSLMLGAIPLTRDYVPIVAMCPTYHTTSFNPLFLESNQVMTWHLPAPMYVPPNVALSAQFTQTFLTDTSLGSAFDGPLRFTVHGRSLPADFPVPESIFVPWATHTRNLSPTDTRFVSKDRDLSNPFPQPMRVTSFVGHAPYITTSGGTPSAYYSSMPVPLTARMTLSSNSILVQSETPFYGLFSPSRRVMPVNGILQANEFVRAIVNAPVGFSTGSANLGMADLSIGMIGYRVLKTPTGSWT